MVMSRPARRHMGARSIERLPDTPNEVFVTVCDDTEVALQSPLVDQAAV